METFRIERDGEVIILHTYSNGEQVATKFERTCNYTWSTFTGKIMRHEGYKLTLSTLASFNNNDTGDFL